MAIYEYECLDCGHQFEQFRKITDETMPDCEECTSANVKKLISQTSFILKGSGWYVTDYARKGATASHSHEKAEMKPESGDDAGSADAPSEPTESTEQKPDTGTEGS
jgi:putative FmdB family regulatory protein